MRNIYEREKNGRQWKEKRHMTDDETGRGRELGRGERERERRVGGSGGGEEREKREGDKALGDEGEEETSDVEGLRKSQKGRRRDGE